MTKSRIFLYFCLSFIGGIFLNSIFKIPQLIMLGLLIFGLILISVLWPRRKIVIIGFCVLFLILGVWRHQIAESRITNNELRKYNDKEQNFTFIGKIIKEPDTRENHIKLVVEIEEKIGKVLVTTGKYSEYNYGDKLKIRGFFKNPFDF